MKTHFSISCCPNTCCDNGVDACSALCRRIPALPGLFDLNHLILIIDLNHDLNHSKKIKKTLIYDFFISDFFYR